MSQIKEASEEQKEQIRQLVHEAVAGLTLVPDKARTKATVESMVALMTCERSSLSSSLYSSLGSSLRSSLSSSLHSSLHSSLYSSLGSSLYSSLNSSLDSSLYSSQNSSLDSSLYSSQNSSLDSSLYSSLYSSLNSSLYSSQGLSLGSSLRSSLSSSLHSSLHSSLGLSLGSSLRSSLSSSLHSSLDSSLYSSQGLSLRSGLCVGVFWRWWQVRYKAGQILGVKYDTKKYNLFNDYCDCCTLGVWTKQGVYIFAPPTTVSMVCVGETEDDWRLPIYDLHADGEPSVIIEGNKLYHWHNTAVPEQYGSTKSTDWKSEWLLTEDNAELRRILIEGIGYERIIKDLQAEKLDSWREYELYRIKQEIDMEPIVLNKMICPSTGHIHVLRVPPEMTSARSAAEWCNWGIDPTEFSAEH